ncbi:peptidoglycan-binding protein [Nodularia sphaerocarpa]|uniref:peptidoglycan-binding domain-containing protein n=1 Tax=Nodularia sphaerocarpa TaxID=137816 RepID=UPI001EFAE9D5|nr:peptidoglycan-binding protein [Nodularia sphaerocarpa]MDB9375247.1 peptidoglycan-binding protein [Nodularia sphaerocarpa CS-585]MDB9378745.1 peptidoglycan-binding protein [Nodularia sphaerocarpa CS-585A2]ULP74244.1 Zinc D-Ala-D-Ala carboxypeptidase [Nodularia sphaerocarpa UHCC 0038]
MDNLAYLYIADAYENSASSELVSLSTLLNKASAPDWKRLSSRAWKQMLPLALALSILSSVSSVLALERGDEGPSVRNLQEKLQKAGFYQAPITQVYDFSTEDAVRRFQEAYGLPVDGVVGETTRQKLETWPTQQASNQPPRQSNNNPQLPQLSTASTPFATISNSNPQPPKPNTPISNTTVNTVKAQTTSSNSNVLQLGDEGEEVKVLQRRLRVAGFYSSQATGQFGPITEEAVKRFQEAYKLDADGIVGPATMSKLPPVGVGGIETPPSPRQTVNTDNLSRGNRGEAVRLLQQHLIQAGYLNGTPDGYFGSQTADAVTRFQAANYLAASGIAGPTTRAKLYSLIKTGSQSEFSILEIQRRLQDKGFYQGNLNGVMADDTKRAIKKAQEFYGISLSDIRGGRF